MHEYHVHGRVMTMSSTEEHFLVANGSVDQENNFDDRITRVVGMVYLVEHYI